jgi:uncharacterized protein
MLFVATCTDKPDHLPVRLENRPAHLAYLEGLGAKVRSGGALLTPDQKSPIGSLLVLEAETEAEVREWLAADPYAKAGLFASVDVKPWRQGAGVVKLG